jgi:hypothetical protein
MITSREIFLEWDGDRRYSIKKVYFFRRSLSYLGGQEHD